MYAVFRSGGKQYRAAKGDVLRLEKIDAEEGDTISFDEVLLVGEGSDIKVGNPLVDGGSVSGKVLSQGRTKKVNVVKFRRRQNYLRQGTHRQYYTEVEIIDIAASGGKATSEAGSAAGPAAKKTARKTTKKKAAGKTAKKAASKKKTAKKASAKKDD